MAHGVWPASYTVAQLSLIGSCQGQAIVNVHHFTSDPVSEAGFSGPTDDAGRLTWVTNLMADWRTNVLSAYRAMHTGDWAINEIKGQVLEVPGQFERRLAAVSDTTGLPLAGTLGGTPPNSDDLTTALVIRWRTALASRHTRGRSYIGPLDESASALGKLVGGGTLATAAAAYITAMQRYMGAGAGVAAGYQMVIYSRPYSSPHGDYVKRVGGVLTVVSKGDYNGAISQVTSGTVDTILRVQRRREIGVGS